MYEETVIGFDARDMETAYILGWPQDRRERFLLKEELAKPLSIDVLVWPSIFLPAITFVGGTSQDSLYETDLKIPVEYRSLDNLWRNLGEMQRYLKDHLQTRRAQYWEIAITEFMSKSDKEELVSKGVFKPNAVSQEWRLLGYDVSNSDFRSALTGSAYEKSEIQILRQRWAPYLNESHLFTDLKQAREFANWADGRDIGHAPCSVNGLYLVQRVNAE